MSDRLTSKLRGPAPEALEAARRFADRAAAEHEADLAYTTFDSPLGTLLMASGERGLSVLHYLDEPLEEALEYLSGKRSPRIVESPGALDPWRFELDEYFAGQRRNFEAALDWDVMTRFQRAVLRATAAIPYGETSTYTGVATEAGSPRGQRAAGNALGANPMAIIIPCHRVLHLSGGYGGYTGGLQRKHYLLELEAGRL
ncbi:MAG TPA: methylated-DNA--[protein]-cysteine S-methyltransferase [Solirubrobacteraceae bacterium]|jgi:methylated-DNA-[protein]-cysteine S-methyltransferase|nr:methylated-DNA--[protein]-cysteine S-methyltransferase [Solirubrobacteraceae bacterium]